MPSPADSLTLLRDSIQERLEDLEIFSSDLVVEVINEEAGNLEQKIAIAIGKIGVLCVVPTPRLATGELNMMRRAIVRVDFFENVLLNRKAGTDYKTAPELLIAAHNALSDSRWLPAGGWQALEFQDHDFEVKGNAVHHTLTFGADLLIDLTGESTPPPLEEPGPTRWRMRGTDGNLYEVTVTIVDGQPVLTQPELVS